jgi:hypothetical protein
MREVQTELGPAYVVGTVEDGRWLWEWLKPFTARGDWLSWDGETNGLDPWARDFKLRTCQISDGAAAYIIQTERPGMVAVTREITRVHPRWVAHYAENDMRFAERGAPGSVRLDSIDPHFTCTHALQAWYDPRTVTGRDIFSANGKLVALNAGLKPSSRRILGTNALQQAEEDFAVRCRELAPAGKRTKNAAKSWGFANIDIDDEVFLRYAALDALCEIRMFHVMAAECFRRGQWPEVCKTLRRQWHNDLMTFRGMLVDDPYARWLLAHYQQVIADNAALLDSVGVNPSGMGPSVGKAFERLGIRSTRTTPEGAPSWDKVMIGSIIDNEHLAITEDHHKAVAVAKALTVVRQATKFIPAYIQHMIAAGERDGRIHPSLREIGAVTSRQSAARPAVHQMPKRTSQLIRAAFIAPPGWVIVSADLKQGEPRTMAALSGDKNLQRDIEAGDINSTLAALTYGEQFIPEDGKDANKPSYDLRQRGKAGFLADCYGAGLKKLASAMLLKVPTERAEEIRNRWHSEYDALDECRNRLNNQRAVVLDNGWVVPLWDRYDVLPDGSMRFNGSKPSRLGLNAATQGNQKVILSIAHDRVINWGWSWALLILVHDEIVCCVPNALAEQCRQMLEAAMTMDFHGFPIRCDATIDGPSWMPQTEFTAEQAVALAAATEGE